MTFDDFLDMLSVFSENAPRDVKVYFAFKIYGNSSNFIWNMYRVLNWLSLDYNNDHFITTYDIEQATGALTRNELGPEEIAVVCDKVLEEANNDDDGKISLAEFQQVITRAPDFLRSVL